jgi:hypothetical protein
MLPSPVVVALGDVVTGTSVSGEVLPGPSVRSVVALGDDVVNTSVIGMALTDGEIVISATRLSVGDVVPLGNDVAGTSVRLETLSDGEAVAVLSLVGVMVTVGVIVSPSKVAFDVGTYVSCPETNETPSAKKQTRRYAAPVSLQLPVIIFIGTSTRVFAYTTS